MAFLRIRFCLIWAGHSGTRARRSRARLLKLAADAALVLSLSKDGRTRLAVVRQAHHWGGGCLATDAAVVARPCKIASGARNCRYARLRPWEEDMKKPAPEPTTIRAEDI